MPPFPGEEILATVYVDAHTYFDAPTPRPFLHRFDKSSYFYIYYNSTRQTSRIEVALHPGTTDQAAFNGYLDNVHVTNSHLFPTRVTLVVDATSPATASPASARSSREPDEWRLASADPRDPGTTKYRIHTVDFYFWNQEDSKLIVDICKRLLQSHQLDVDEHEEPEEQYAHELEAQPEPDRHDTVSAVVQNLEHVAISDPAYRKDKSHEPAGAQHAGYSQMPPPPPQPLQAPASAHAAATAANVDRTPSVQASGPGSSSNFVPLAYNPAAPAAPEPIAHREDTPPPIDATDGTGLATAAKHDHLYGHPHPQQPYTGSVGMPGGPHPDPYGHNGSPPPPSLQSHHSFGPQSASLATSLHPSFGPSSALQTSPRTSASTFGAQPQPQPQPPLSSSATSSAENNNSSSSRHPSIAAQHYIPNTVQDPNAHIFGGQQPVQSPGSQFYQAVNATAQPHKPLQHIQPQYPDYLAAGSASGSSPPPPMGGYAAYNYSHPAGQQQPGVGSPAAAAAAAGNKPYDIHNQVYRPTEDEHNTHHHQRKPSRTSTSSHHQPSTSERLEKGVGRFFKKIEKKIG
ncbi:hypothetical protein H2202_000738 [Exophiala xenobiotica]|nr:hypothetical protein H2202_000738 [Exophiala xenobiotica]